jgi:hypothetical protein
MRSRCTSTIDSHSSSRNRATARALSTQMLSASRRTRVRRWRVFPARRARRVRARSPGFSPHALIEHMQRGVHAIGSSRSAHSRLRACRQTQQSSHVDGVGAEGVLAPQARASLRSPCFCSGFNPFGALYAEGGLFRGAPQQITYAVAAGALVFHAGSIRGALPQLVV